MTKENYKIRFNKKFVVSVGVINNYSGIVNFIKEELDSQLQDILLEVEGMNKKEYHPANQYLEDTAIAYNQALSDVQAIIKNRMKNI